MTSRERWILYPLVFFTFLMAARDKYIKPQLIDCQVVTCRQMQVLSDEGRTVVTLGTTLDESGNEAGVLITYGPPAGSGHLAAPQSLSPPDGPTDARGRLKSVGMREGDSWRCWEMMLRTELRLQHDPEQRESGLTALQIGEATPHWSSTVQWPPADRAVSDDATDPADGGDNGPRDVSSVER